MSEQDCSAQLGTLTLRQRECLREVARGYQTKDIARNLGMSPHRVNKLIFEARKTLGGVRRGQAARLLVEWEDSNTGTSDVYSLGAHSLGLPETRHSGSAALTDNRAAKPTTPGETEDGFAEEQKSYSARNSLSALVDLMPLRTSGRRANDLSTYHILIVSAILTAAALVAAGSAISLLSAFNSLADK